MEAERDSIDDIIEVMQYRAQRYGDGGNSESLKRPRDDGDGSLYDESDNDDGMTGGGGGGDLGHLFADSEEDGDDDDDDDRRSKVLYAAAPSKKQPRRTSMMASEAEEVSDGEEEDVEDLLGGGEDDSDDPQSKAIQTLTVTTRSGKDVGRYVPKLPLDLDEAYEYVTKRQSSKEDNYEKLVRMEYEQNKRQKLAHHSAQATASTAQEKLNQELHALLERYNVADPQEDVSGSIIITNPVDANTSPATSNDDNDATDTTDVNDWSNDKIDDYIRERYDEELRDANITYERFMSITCPLCAYGNMSSDPIYAPKLQMVRKMAKHGVIGGHMETTAMLITLFWNRYIMRPMIKRGQRIMRLTYDMSWKHISEPHVPDPEIEMRLDMRQLNKLSKISSNSVTRQNQVTGELDHNEKLINASVRSTMAKHTLRKTKPETMAFYAPHDDYATEYMSSYTNPYMQVHFGSKELPRNVTAKRVTARTMQKKQDANKGGHWVPNKSRPG